MDWSKWNVQNCIGFDLGNVPISFSIDNRKAFAASKTKVIIFDVENGERLLILSHESSVVGTHQNAETNELNTYTEDGYLHTWNLESGVMLRKRMVYADPLIDCLDLDGAVIVLTKSEEGEFEVKRITYRDVESIVYEALTITEAHQSNRDQCALGVNFFVLCEGLFVYLYKFDGPVKKFKFTGKTDFIDPKLVEFSKVTVQDDTIAAALSFGRIFIWENVSQQGIKKFTHSIHWHKSAPSMVLTTFGSLLSAGGEGVVNKFTLSKAKNIGKPTYLPRMQAPILRLSSSKDNSTLAAVLADNSLHFILPSTMTVLSSAKTILSSQETSLIHLISDPANPQLLIYSARPGVIQWIDPQTLLTIATADISSQNPPDAPNPSNPEPVGFVDVCAIACSMKYIVTAECHVKFAIPFNRLQFWSRKNELGGLSLVHSFIYGDIALKEIRAGFTNDLFVTIDEEGKISFWTKSDDHEQWNCSNNIHWKQLKISHVSLINDSLLAVVHQLVNEEGVLAIWNVNGKNQLPLHIYEGDGSIRCAEWCHEPYNHLLFVGAQSFIGSFDIKSLSFLWVISEPNLSIGVSPEFYFAFSLENKSVTLLNSKSAEVHYKLTVGEFPKCFITVGTGSDLKIICATNKDLYLITQESEDAQMRKLVSKVKTFKMSPFCKLIPVKEHEEGKEKIEAEASADISIVSGAAHTMAPVSQLAEPFIESCFKPKS